jgi:hypothetical protein
MFLESKTPHINTCFELYVLQSVTVGKKQKLGFKKALNSSNVMEEEVWENPKLKGFES